MFGLLLQQNDLKKRALDLWENAEDDEERFEACIMMEKCKNSDLESLMILSSWYSFLKDDDKVLACCKEGADLWSDLPCISRLVEFFKRQLPDEEENYEFYLKKGANLHDSSLIIKCAHWIQEKARNSSNTEIDEQLKNWTQKAAALKDPISLRFLADCAADAAVTSSNPDEHESSLSLYIKAANAGNIESFLIASSLLLQNPKNSSDYSLALDFLAKSARLTFDYQKLVKIGLCLASTESEVNLPADPETAYSFFEEAAVQGNLEACALMADCLYYGLGIEQNKIEAQELYQKAVDGGLLWALPGLIKCELDQGQKSKALINIKRLLPDNDHIEAILEALE